MYESRSGTSRQCPQISLREMVSGVVIVAHNEDTTALRAALISEGLSVDEVRGPYTPEQLTFAAITRCMVNHANAWRIAARRSQPTIIVEADFVPVKGFGGLMAPLPLERISSSLAYLYAAGPEIWDLAGPHFARGHGGGLVATLIPPTVASQLLHYVDEEMTRNPLGTYSPFDTEIGYWLKDRGVQSYIPYRHYGEHGGIPNPEHAVFGLGRPHQADVLHTSLAFLPAYANGSRLRYWRTRMRARAWGVLRLITGRFVARHNLLCREWLRIIRFSVGRLFFLEPLDK